MTAGVVLMIVVAVGPRTLADSGTTAGVIAAPAEGVGASIVADRAITDGVAVPSTTERAGMIICAQDTWTRVPGSGAKTTATAAQSRAVPSVPFHVVAAAAVEIR
jgi:hypothetical protein